MNRLDRSDQCDRTFLALREEEMPGPLANRSKGPKCSLFFRFFQVLGSGPNCPEGRILIKGCHAFCLDEDASMWKNVSLVLRAAIIVAIPVLIQTAGSRYLAHRAKAIKAADVDKDYALMRDGSGKPAIPGAERLNLDGLDSTVAVPKLKSMRTEKSAPAPDPTRPTMLMRYVGPDPKQGKVGSTSVMELPPGTSVMFLDGRLQVYHPPKSCGDQ